MNIKERRLKFLEETIAYYSEDTSRRSVQNPTTSGSSVCFYRHPDDGRPCAIGRWIPDKAYSKLMEHTSADDVFVLGNIQWKVRILGGNFLKAVQRLHDHNGCWNENGLTLTGKYNLDQIGEITEKGNGAWRKRNRFIEPVPYGYKTI